MMRRAIEVINKAYQDSIVVGTRPSLLTKFMSEFIGCMIFHFVGSVSAMPLTNAAALAVLVYYTARMSGGHLNPALSLTFTILGYTNVIELIVYWFAQCAGAVAGAMFIAAAVPGLTPGSAVATSPYSGCFVPAADLSDARVFAWEAICTFCFLLPVFSVVWYTQEKSGYGNTGPLIVGISLYAAASAAAPWTGAALNPARAIASQVVFRCPDPRKTAFYVVGEFLAAMLVPIAVAPWYGVAFEGGQAYRTTKARSGNGSSDRDAESALCSTQENAIVASPTTRRSMEQFVRIISGKLPMIDENSYFCSSYSPRGTPTT